MSVLAKIGNVEGFTTRQYEGEPGERVDALARRLEPNCIVLRLYFGCYQATGDDAQLIADLLDLGSWLDRDGQLVAEVRHDELRSALEAITALGRRVAIVEPPAERVWQAMAQGGKSR